MNSSNISLKKFFFQLIKPYKRYVVALFFTALYWGVNNALSPYVLKLIIDKVASFEGDKAQIFTVIMPYVVLYMVLWILIAIDMRFLDWVRMRLFPSLRYDVINSMFKYLNQHSHQYFQNNFAGSLANKIMDMMSGMVTIFSTLDDGVAQCIAIIIAIISMLLVNPVFSLFLGLWVMAFFLVTAIYFKPIRDQSNYFATAKSTVMGNVVDSISNMTNLRLFSRHTYEKQLIQEAMQDTVNKDRMMQQTILKMRIFWDVSIIVLIGGNLYLLVTMYSKNQVTIGDFSFIISLSISIFYNLWYLASQFVTFAEELGKCRQALTIISVLHEIRDQPNAKALVVTKGEIEFDNVTFHYDEGAHLFNNKNIIFFNQ